MKKSFDKSTGQTFVQWDAPVPSAMSRPWNRQLIQFRSASLIDARLHDRSSPFQLGPAPLVHTCIKVAAEQVDELEKEHLQHLPIPLVKRIWERVRETSFISLETWKLLAGILVPSGQFEAAKGSICSVLMNHTITVPKTQPLAAYIGPLISDTFDFLTHLTTTGSVRGSSAELLRLVQLKNLAVLEILSSDPERDRHNSPRLTDSIVREWSTTPGAFPVLRILRVWGEAYTTKHSLRYVSAFPSLVWYDVAGNVRDWEDADESVWLGEDETWKSRSEKTLRTHLSILNQSLVPDRSMESNPPPVKGSWGLVLYTYIGSLISNRDLKLQGLELNVGGRTVSEEDESTLPPRPMVNINLTEEVPIVPPDLQRQPSELVSSKHFEVQISFIRRSHPGGPHEEAPRTGPVSRKDSKRSQDASSTASNIPPRKRQNVSSLLESFGKG